MANQKYNITLRQAQSGGELKGDSNSIQNQRLPLKKYAAENGFVNTKFLYDDGINSVKAGSSRYPPHHKGYGFIISPYKR